MLSAVTYDKSRPFLLFLSLFSFTFLYFQVVQMAGLFMEARVSLSLILQPRSGKMLENIARIWERTLPLSDQPPITISFLT